MLIELNVSYDRTTKFYEQRIEEIKDTKGIKLHLGCGNMVLENFINIDKYRDNPRVLKADMGQLPLSDNYADLIYSSHSLEHMPISHAILALKEWHRVLKDGGVLHLAVPDLENIMKHMLDPNISVGMKRNWYMYTMFGYQISDGIPLNSRQLDDPVDPGQFHTTGFTKELLADALGLLYPEEMWTYDGYSTPSLYCKAVKGVG